jgi:monothiol glutaredoxin
MSEKSENPLRDAIAEAIRENDVILFMKGTPEMPACGFSARTVAAIQATGAPFAAVDVLPDPRIRQELSALSNWPTIPQLFIGGELVGGCDIVTEMYETGELAEALGVQQPAQAPDSATAAAEQQPEPAVAAAREQPAPRPLGVENRLQD